jgi:hypothetical protein
MGKLRQALAEDESTTEETDLESRRTEFGLEKISFKTKEVDYSYYI